MENNSNASITLVLEAVARGETQAAEALLPLVYDELRRLARSRLAKEAPGQTLEPTALVHEAFLRLVGDGGSAWNNRGHFFGAAALAMRRILVEQARRKQRLRHGGGHQRVEGDMAEFAMPRPDADIVALDEALNRLEAEDPRKVQIVNFRFFAGMTAEEAAELLGISLSTVEREWRYTRAWLFHQISADDKPPTSEQVE